MTLTPRGFTIARRLSVLMVLEAAGLAVIAVIAVLAIREVRIGGRLYEAVAETHALRLTGVDARTYAAQVAAVAAQAASERDRDAVNALQSELRRDSDRIDAALTRLLAAVPEPGARDMLLAAQRTWYEVDDLNADVFKAKLEGDRPALALLRAQDEMIHRFSEQLDSAVSLLAMRTVDIEQEVAWTVGRRLQTLAALGGVLVLGGGVLSLVITRSVTVPLRRLTTACARAGAGDLSARLGLARADELGTVSRAFDAMLDDLARSRTELATAEARYRSLISHLPDVAWTARADRTPTYVSPNIEAMFGYTVEEFYADPTAIWPGSVHPDDLPGVLAAYDGLFGEGRPFEAEYRMRRKDGTWIWVHGRALAAYDLDGSRYADGVVTDITERKRVDALLAESERRYRLLAENTSDFIWSCDLRQRPTYVSPSVQALTGFSPEEVMASGFGAILTPASHAASLAVLKEALGRPAPRDPADALRRGQAFELEHRRRDGSTVWTEVRAAFALDERGRPMGIAGVTRDITERKKMDRMREDFVSFTMHQLRTPLAGIKWMLELADQSTDPVERQSFVDDARASADRLIGLVNDLLATARLEHGRVTVNTMPTDLSAVTREVLKDVEPLIEAGRLQVSLHASPDLSLVDSDPRLLREVLMNLVGNALKFTPREGTIAITIAAGGDGLRWAVRDSGVGIPRAEQDRLFQKFYRAESTQTVAPEGTGLGLYMSRLIVNRLGGTIGYESEPGQGALFHFTIPGGLT